MIFFEICVHFGVFDKEKGYSRYRLAVMYSSSVVQSKGMETCA